MNFVRLSILTASAFMLAASGAALAAEHAGDKADKADKVEKSEKKVEYSDHIKEELAKRDLRLGEPVGRLRQIRISGWNRLDRQHLLLTVGVSEKYLMRLMRECQGLSDNATVQFTTVGSDVTDMDQVKVTGGPGRDSCQIQEIRKLEKVEKEEKEGKEE